MVFPFGKVSEKFICQKSLLSEGTLEDFEKLYIGEWKRAYCIDALDGIQWHLKISYSNGKKSVKYWGNNAYPFNFKSVLDLFGVERDF